MPSGFLRSWVERNVKVVPVDQREPEALRLSARCFADAVISIPLEALEEAAGSDIKTYMMSALEKASDRAAKRALETARPPPAAKGSEAPS